MVNILHHYVHRFPIKLTYIASSKFAVSTVSIMVVMYSTVVNLRRDVWVFVLNRFVEWLHSEHLLSQSQQLHRAIYDSTQTKMHQSWFFQICSTHMCRLNPQMPHVA